MATLKSLLESLLSLYTRKTELSSELSNYVLKANTEWIGHQSLPQATQTEYEVSSGDSITAPFDGTACFVGENSNSLKGFRIISEKIELNVAAVQSNNTGWASGWVPIEKGKQIRFFVNASESFTARLIPNIQSSL